MPFRNRPIRPGNRPGRRPPHRRPPERLDPRTEKVLARLRQAHRAMESGQFTDAASIFHDLAVKAEDHGIPRAPQLHLQAGRAQILAGSLAEGMQSLEYGLKLMLNLNQELRFRSACQRVLDDLHRLGYDDLAAKLEIEFAGSLDPSTPSAKAEKQDHSHHALPPSCPRCGAIVRPDELEWINRTRAYCDYCGINLEGSK